MISIDKGTYWVAYRWSRKRSAYSSLLQLCCEHLLQMDVSGDSGLQLILYYYLMVLQYSPGGHFEAYTNPHCQAHSHSLLGPSEHQGSVVHRDDQASS